MVTDPKTYVCKYCGAERTVTTQYKSTCKACKSRKVLVRRECDKIPMTQTRIEREGFK